MTDDKKVENCLKIYINYLCGFRKANDVNIVSFDKETQSILNRIFKNMTINVRNDAIVIDGIESILNDLINKNYYQTAFFLWARIEDREKTYELFKKMENEAIVHDMYRELIMYTPNNILERIINELKTEENINIRNKKAEMLRQYSNADFITSYYKDIYKLIIDETLDIEVEKKIENVNKSKLNPYFVFEYGKICTEEQLYRLASDGNIQLYMVELSKNKLIYSLLSYVLKNDDNWIISLNNILEHLKKKEYEKLIKSTQNIKDDKINDEVVQLLLAVISDTNNYFEINTYEDLTNYENKRIRFCVRILTDYENIITKFYRRYLTGEWVYIPESLKGYTEEELYQFALLEYKFGISLEYARVLLQRYGKDIKELPEGVLKDYLLSLSEVVHCDDIEGIVNFAIKDNKLNQPWKGYPNAREAEGKILNLFAELYNQTLYKPNEDDKEDYTESYIDQDGNQYNIEVYKIKKDFRMCARAEAAYIKKDKEFCDKNGEIIDYKKYYTRKNIRHHINSESYISNDNISLIKSDEIIVGYEQIHHNQLGGASPKVKTPYIYKGITTASLGENFSIYGAKDIEMRVPHQMIDNTRIISNYKSANEIYKDRILTNQNGKVEQYKPSYVVWIEEDTEEERKNPEWKKDRELDSKWIKTKKAAAQLGVPIVIIDREYFAKREMKKTEVMKKLITGDEIKENEYKDFVKEYKKYTKPEIIRRLFTKFENNRTGMINNFNLECMYFSSDYRLELRKAIFGAINKMDEQDARECLNALIEVAKREISFEIEDIMEVKKKVKFYNKMMEMAKSKLAELVGEQHKNPLKPNISTNTLLELYFSRDISKEDLVMATEDNNKAIRRGGKKNGR